MLLLIRMVLLAALIVVVTLLGIVFCLLTLGSKNRVYHLAHVLSSLAPVFGLRVETRQSEAANKVPQAVYVGNHQNNYDLFTLAAMVPKGVVTVGKKSLRWIPFFGVLYWVSGNILINRDNRKQAIATIDQVVVSMQKTGLSILMFPEGTRSRGRGWLPFKRGAFYAAIQAGVPIVPIVCSDTHRQVHLNRWNNGRVIVETLDPIDTAGVDAEDVGTLLALCESRMHEAKQRLDAELAGSSSVV
ncbi:1-acylglycerol-3-phosphate O-acyltransferase [Marinomonas algarum]|uniref:1-acyl-sn-glycerol-3-phosphate acyltransferase n=1 Tax=Marinomonas algarum TaxID=2883105 RepID=A0A9X1IQV5_9GAMM|nr:1-acylglycerol-3-phosphate O-acyltransferase [Marinomonas algarum]MCB5162556.1 1-acylglycerol-3-phosphate O-acyltransferase [Marinomonas algarum]